MTDPDLVGKALGDFMGSGWVRHLPHCALFIFGAAATLEAESRTGSLEQVEAYARDGGLAALARLLGSTRSSGRTSITTPVPSVRRAKKSGACLRSPRSPDHNSQNGWAENPTISGSKSSSIATSRSTHDSYPTCSPVVADHHSPGKFRCPLKEGNDLDGPARSNGRFQHDGRGSRR